MSYYFDIIQSVDHKIQACGASTGHFIKTVAMCDTDEIAAFLFEAVNSHASLTEELDRLREENETFRIGIKRLSDEEEKLAETTDGEEFSLVSIAAQLASVEIANRRLTDALSKVDWWARQRCPCENEDPNPCPLCGASVENLEACKSAENTFPRELLETVRSALTFIGGRS